MSRAPPVRGHPTAPCPPGRASTARALRIFALVLVPWVLVLHEPDEVQGASGPQAAASTQEVIVELRIGRLARRTVPALERGEEALLPVADLLELGEVHFEIDDDGTLHAALQPDDRQVVLRPDAALAQREDAPVPVAPDAALVRDGELFVAVPLLEELFALTIRVDWNELTAVVMDPETLPLGRRIAREARWRNLRGEDPEPSAGLRLDPERPGFGGGVMDWSVSSSVHRPRRLTGYRVGLGTRLRGGSLKVTAYNEGAELSGRQRVDASYRLVRPGSDQLTQIRLGDDFATGPRVRSIRGIALTNAPFLRPGLFGTDSFDGRVGPGWDVELRRSGRTLDVTRADEAGAFALDIPLRYGNNPIQVVAFGPHGEVVTAERLVFLGRDRIPGGAFEWGLSGGACRSDRCDGTGNLDLRYGVSDRWTVRAGAEGFFRDTVPNLLQPYAGVSGAVTPSLHLGAEGLGRGLLRGRGTFTPSPDLRLRAAHTRFSTSVDAPVLHDARRRSTTEADVFARPLPGFDRLLLRGSCDRRWTPTS